MGTIGDIAKFVEFCKGSGVIVKRDRLFESLNQRGLLPSCNWNKRVFKYYLEECGITDSFLTRNDCEKIMKNLKISAPTKKVILLELGFDEDQDKINKPKEIEKTSDETKEPARVTTPEMEEKMDENMNENMESKRSENTPFEEKILPFVIAAWTEDKSMILNAAKENVNDGTFSLPNKIDIFKGLDISEQDGIFIKYEKKYFNQKYFRHEALLVNGSDRIVGCFNIAEYTSENGENEYFLTAYSNSVDFEEHESSHYYFVFKTADDEYGQRSRKYHRVDIEVAIHETEMTETHLCIDFGTSNTTAGCFLDNNYVKNLSNLAVINGNVELNSENFVRFAERDKKPGNTKKTLAYRNVVPTIVYVYNCSYREYIRYCFGYDATAKIKEDKFCPKASCFMEIKRWTSNIDVREDIQDKDGNKAQVSRREILSEYLMFIIRNAENQFKCKFKNIHISAPVKLKSKVLGIYSEILKEHGYTLETEHAIDEGVCVLYSIISDQIRENKYRDDEEKKALIIDCGGGTSDLASCRYKIHKDEDGIVNLDITTEYMNGDVNFGGNNLTYRIMQYMKIVYMYWINSKGKERKSIDNLIHEDINTLFSYIEGEGDPDETKVKKRYEELYKIFDNEYAEAEKVIPTRYKDYENRTKEDYDKVKNNFYFLWTMAEEMKKEFYKSTSITRYRFFDTDVKNEEMDLHINRIEQWKLSTMDDKGGLKEQKDLENITFTSKEIDKLLRGDIYYLVRKFLNGLYEAKELDKYSRVKLSGQSSKINIFMDALKEFLPGKMITGRASSKGNDAEELKLLCLKGSVMYFHALEKSNVEVTLKNDIRNIPVSGYVKNENGEETLMFERGENWDQKPTRRRITTAAKELYFYMRDADHDIAEPYKYVCKDIEYTEIKPKELEKLSKGKINQEFTDSLPVDKKYACVFLDKERWGFTIIPLRKDKNGKLFKGEEDFRSFEMDILQKKFFDGRR